MAVPIVLGEQVLGVLDVQEDELAGLDESDANLLRSLANQVAVAIRNARLFAEVETALTAARELQRQYVEQAWDKSQVARRGVTRVQFSLESPTTLDEATVAEARRQAMTQKEPAVIVFDDGEQENRSQQATDSIQQAIVAPITLHGSKIGNLQLHEVEPDRKWSAGELAIINAIVDQVAQVAENLRLINETQERASRERLIGQVSDKLRRAPDMETLIKTAVNELSRVLNPARTFVRFGSETTFGVTLAESPHNGETSEQAAAVYLDELNGSSKEEVAQSNGNEQKMDRNGQNDQ
jgi:GAF domain-containing protein